MAGKRWAWWNKQRVLEYSGAWFVSLLRHEPCVYISGYRRLIWMIVMKFWPWETVVTLTAEVAELERKLEKAQLRISDLLLEKFQLEAALEAANQYQGLSPSAETPLYEQAFNIDHSSNARWITPITA